MSGARVLIMDEPTSALSPAEVEQLMRLVGTLREQKRSIIYISHFLEEVLRVADRITVLRNGKKVATLDRAEATMEKLISLMLGREVGQMFQPPESVSESTEPLLEVEKLQADVFTDIDLRVGRGEIGLYGAIGAGHFDLARALFAVQDRQRHDQAGSKTFPRNHSARYAIRAAGLRHRGAPQSAVGRADHRNITMPHLSARAAHPSAQPGLPPPDRHPAGQRQPPDPRTAGN